MLRHDTAVLAEAHFLFTKDPFPIWRTAITTTVPSKATANNVTWSFGFQNVCAERLYEPALVQFHWPPHNACHKSKPICPSANKINEKGVSKNHYFTTTKTVSTPYFSDRGVSWFSQLLKWVSDLELINRVSRNLYLVNDACCTLCC